MNKVHQVIIVGAGPTGVAAAAAFAENGIKALILDVGHQPPPQPSFTGDFYDFRKKHDAFDIMIGDHYEGLHNIFHKTSMSPKLTSPLMRYVTRDAERLSPVNETGFKGVQSFAAGGLANAWGAGLYRYSDRDLQSMPISASELEPYYDQLTREIGILGSDDDLTPYFGSTRHLLKPLKLSAKAALLYRRYQKRRTSLNKQGIFMGYPRLGVLSVDHQGRRAAGSDSADAWIPHLPYIYNPVFTLERLIKEDKVWYQKGFLVSSWQRKNQELIVQARDLNKDTLVSFKTRTLLLAAGTINTARIILESRKDHQTELKLLDNPLVQIPLIFPGFIGKRLEKGPFGMGHINMIFDLKQYDMLLQGGILEITSPARAVFYEQFPFSARHNIRLIRLVTNAVMVMLLFFPSSEENAARLRLTPEGILEIRCQPYRLNKRIVKSICRSILKLGLLTTPRFIQYSPPGYGIHYAGTIPMKEKPTYSYQCDRLGQLYGEPGVHIVDGSVLPEIAARNLSLTLMANAMRSADALSKKIKK